MCKKIIFFVLVSSALCFMACNTTESYSGAKNGTYTSAVRGMNDMVEVSVTVQEGKIKAVAVTKESETPGIGSPLKNSSGRILNAGGKTPVELIPEAIVKYQSTNVDAVTGATITSAAIKTAVRNCLSEAGVPKNAFAKEQPKPATPSNASADVVIVGGGGSGLAAAVAAAESGASVIVIEKNGSVGGDTLVCGAIYNTPDQPLQRVVTMTDAVKRTIEAALAEKPVSNEHKDLQDAVRKQWDTYKSSGRTDLFDSKEWYALQTWNGGDKVAKLDIVKRMCYNAYDDMKWIEDLGMKFEGSISQGAGALWQRTHTSVMQMGTGFLSTYVAQLEKMNKVTILTESTGKSLIKDDSGKVTGVKCVANKTGKEFTVSGKYGVVLATGGFSANGAMVQRFNTTGKWQDLSKVPTTNRFSSSQGDGITMAEAAGASLTDMIQIQLLYLGNIQDGQLTKYPPRDVNGTDQIIFINKEGKRFTNEGGRRDDICLAVFKQTDAVFYMLESGDGAGYVDINDPSWRSADGFTFEYLEKNNFVTKADTLDELAQKLGMDPATLKASVDSFNASVDEGVDKDGFNRTLFTTKLTKGPWVATPRQACVHHTMGGITVDSSTHVLDTKGNPIKGLYACGETTGGLHGGNRLGGNAVVDTVVFGRLAGSTIVADAK